jgi:UDP:flavonoid glycosyltransferase YjiC (YdhE family)
VRILVNAFGTAGDVNPLLAVALALAAQGHQPLLALNPACETAARATGLPFFPVGPRWDVDEVAQLERYLDPNRGGIRVWEEICLPNVGPSYRDLSFLIAEQRPDAVLAHFLCVAAHWAARVAQVPCALATLAPCWWVSKGIPATFAPQVPPAWLHPHVVWVARTAINLAVSRPLRRVCRELGRPFRRDEYFRIFAEADLNLGLWSPALRPAADDDPPRSRICGFPFGPPPPPVDARVQAFLDAGPAPVVVGLGSSVRNLGSDILPHAARACEQLGRRALLIGAEVAGLPSTALAVRAVPYAAVFPRAAAVLHHGGVGTTAEALRCGKPTVVAPFASDQFDNALLCARAGTSVTLARSRLTTAGIAAALGTVLSDEALARRATMLGEVLRAQPDGAEVAAREVARFAAGARIPRAT